MPDITRFRRLVLDHYRRHGRRFPWRQTRDPYQILVSEFMLQQTQTSRVLNYFDPFVAFFPDASTLSAADRGRVLAAWSGLGYNRRAVALHRAATIIVCRFSGKVPHDAAELRSLPGVGPATAGAVQAFGFGLPSVFVETNIRRAALHELFPDREQVNDRELLPLLSEALDRSDPRRWYWALMDYGSTLARRDYSNPNRRSAHHSLQSTFHGSNRQQRGRILKALATRGPLSFDKLTTLIGANDRPERERALHNVDVMHADGLIDIGPKVVRLASGRENRE